MNPTLSSLPAAASLRQDNGCTYAAGTETYTDYGDGTTTKTLTYAPTGSAVPSNAHIFNAFEDGISSQQDNVISGWGCSTPSLLYDSTGGLDIGLAESKVRKLCYNSEKNSFPNVQSDNSYRGTVGPCGGHTGDYHFHGRYHCLYEQTGEHSTKIGDVGPYIMYGKWEHFTNKKLPNLDACGAHIGITPDSPSEAVYHYHVQDRAPYGVGCYGDGVNLMTVSACRALYSTCGDGDETFTDMPQPDGTLKSFAYDRDCPCFDANGLNTDSSITERAIIAQPSVIAYDASKWTCGDGVSCMQTVEATLGFTDYVGKQDATKSPPSSPAHCDASVAPENGDIGNCTSELPIGQTCRPVCADGFVLALSGKQSYCAPDGKLSYEAECVYDSCFILERNAAQERKQKPMNEIIVHPDGKDEKTVLVSKDEREMHVEVDTMRTRAKLISYANASTNNVVLSKRLIAGGENEEEIDVEKRLTELRKKAVELRERLLRVKYRYTPSSEPELMKFESVGTYAYTAPQTGMAKILVVGGGGGGGGRSGAGGGGGGVVYVESYPVVAGQTYEVQVGSGGAGGSGITGSGKNTKGGTDDDPGKAGSNSVFQDLIALGGGGGGSSWHEGGYPGGSGGGGKYGHVGGASLQSAQPGLSGEYGHGFAGGSGTSGSWNAGGGGGAGSVGVSGTSSVCGNGGNGFTSDITGETVTYGGGGGGGSHNPACSSGGEGGAGGGGKNGMPGAKDSGGNGIDGLGGGGGGGSTTSHHGGNGGTGGSGAVAISCCTPAAALR